MNLKEAFPRIKILKQATPSSMAKLAGCGSLVKMEKGTHLFYDKEEVSTLYFVISGYVTLYKINSNGEKKVIFIYGEGEAINEVILNGLPASINAEMMEAGMLLTFPRERFLSVMEDDFRLSKAVMDSMSIKIRRLYRQLKNTPASVRGDKRIAAKLWKLSMDHGIIGENGVEIGIDLTITYLAEMLGAKRETVSRQLKVLTEAALIHYDGCRFTVPDRDALQNYFKAP